VAVNCGAPDGSTSAEDLQAFRPVDAEGKVLSIDSLEALTVDDTGTRKPLNFTAKGCVFVQKGFSGAIVFRNKKKNIVGFAEQPTSKQSRAVVDIPLTNFPSIKPNLLCSGQEIWTNQPFVQVEWELFRDNQPMATDEVRKVLPLLDIKVASRASDSNGPILQELSLTRAIQLPELSGQAGRFAWQFQVPADDESKIEFRLQDILDRTDELKGPSSCHVHMSTKRPKIISGNERSLLVSIHQGESVPLDTFDDAQLFVQVRPITANTRAIRWSNLSTDRRATELKEFRPGRSPVFWQAGTYIMRAYTENKAGNQSAVWERVIQVKESPLIDHQVSATQWILQKASRRGRPALITIDQDQIGPIIRLKSLDSADDPTVEEWRPQIAKESEGIFRNGFNIDRHLLEGRFGFGNSSLQQTCLIRGSHPSDSWRLSFAGRLLCWQRASSGDLQIVADQDAPFLEKEDLHTLPVGANRFDEILSFDIVNKDIRIMRVATAAGSEGLQEFASFTDGNPSEKVHVMTVAGEGEPGYMVRTAIGQQIIALTQVVRGPQDNKPFSMSDFSFAPAKVDYYSDRWGPQPATPERLHSFFERTSTRMQPVPAWNNQQPTMIYSNIRYHSRWARHIFTNEHQSSRLLTEMSFAGLPSNITDTCFFIGMRCFAYHDEPRSRDDLRIYEYSTESLRWELQTTIDLKTLAATNTLQEDPRPSETIVPVAYGSPYRVSSPSNAELHWKVLPIPPNVSYPNWMALSTVDRARVHEGRGPLQLWGRDERFAVLLEIRDASQQLIRSEIRDLRFEGSPLLGNDLNRGLGLVDLKAQGIPYLVQPEPQGFGVLELGLNDSSWQSHAVPLPDFVRTEASGLGWSMRPVFFVSGHILPDRGPVFCYAAAAVEGRAGSLSCYGWNGQTIESILNMDFPFSEGQEIAALQINNSDRTALFTLDRSQNEFRAFVLEKDLSANKYSVRVLPWVRTQKTADNRVEVIETQSSLRFREQDAKELVSGTLHFGNGADLEPGILHLGGQLQLGPNNSRFALASRFTTSVTGGRLQKADKPELALDMDLDAMDMQPSRLRRLNIFNNFDFTWFENPGLTPLYTTLADRGAFGNLAYSQKVDNMFGCRVEGIFDAALLVTGIVHCSPFLVQTQFFTTVMMDTFFDLNEEYLAQPDQTSTHWSLPYWIPDQAPTADPRQLPVAAMLLRIPKNYQRDGWILQRAGYDFPLRDQGESWSTLRTFSLGSD
jgi:hypothetical protein